MTFMVLPPLQRITIEAIPIPFLTSPLEGEEYNGFPPLQGEGKGGGGVNQMSTQQWPY